ncbi:serine hydrolase domain-containing protein [Sinomicrobium sp. M5D2P17]
MKYIYYPLFLIFSLMGSIASAQKAEEIHEYLQNKMKEHQIPGLQLAVVKNNEIVFSEALGLANLPFSVAAMKSTVFSINSVGKVFTSTAIMQLMEQGKLQLSDPVSRHLKDLPGDWQDITVKQLLSHTSGLPDVEAPNGLVGGKDMDTAWAMLQKLPLKSNPGEKFNYISTNYLLLGKVIEKCSGVPFGQFIQENQWDVAGMFATVYSNSSDVIENKSPTYSYYYQDKVSGEYKKGDRLQELHEEFPLALRTDSGVFSNAGEMAQWIIALQTGKLLKNKETIKTMWQPVPLNNGKYGGFGGIFTAYGLGWPVVQREKHPAVVPIGGGRASFFIYPDDDLAIVLLTNLMRNGSYKIIEGVAGFYLED